MNIDLDSQESIQRMLTSIEVKSGRTISPSTKTTYFIYIRRFCEFMAKTPDEIIKERRKDARSEDIFVQRRHEEKLVAFLSTLREQGYSSNTVSTATGAVKSLYRTNYHPMIEVNIPSPRPQREYKIPTKEELSDVIDSSGMRWHGAFMILTKDCGISLQDMLALKVGDGSQIYGSIKTQIKDGQVPIHLNLTRGKTLIKFHTFLGEDSYESLNNRATFPASSYSSDSKRLFPYAKSTIQNAMKDLGNKRSWTSFTPYSLRKWFRTQLTLSDMNEALIETMMGHSIGAVKEAYLVPPPQKLLEVYEKHYPSLRL